MTDSTNNASTISNGSYVPGVCNINSAEIAYRRKSGYVLLAISLALAAPLLLIDLPVWLRVVLFFPVFLTADCFLQAKHKFCVSYGAAGKQNATEGDKVAQDIIDAAALKLDKARARKINSQAAGIALVITALLLFIP